MEHSSIIHITWAKAFDEIYCHHASLFIPYVATSLFPPEIVCVGVTVRLNNIKKGKVISSYDRTDYCYLPCLQVEGGLSVPIDSTKLIDDLSLNIWTTLKHGKRGSLKVFPLSIFYQILGEDKITILFNHIQAKTPYLISEPEFDGMNDGDKVEVDLKYDENIQETVKVC